MLIDVPCTLEKLREMFPPKRPGSALVGRMSIEFFEKHEQEIREFVMRPHNLRAIYRGPRISNKRTVWNMAGRPSMTRRCDADAVLLYRK